MTVINFDVTYNFWEFAPELTYAKFNTELKSGGELALKVQLKPHPDPLLPNVYNLAFGPFDENDDIDDKVSVPHLNQCKMFSTVLFCGLAFLKEYPNLTIGLDGSNETRAYLYHRMFITNKDYLADYFVPIGVDWYVRLLRNSDVERDVNGFPYFKPRPELFDFQRPARDMYRY